MKWKRHGKERRKFSWRQRVRKEARREKEGLVAIRREVEEERERDKERYDARRKLNMGGKTTEK